MKTPLITTLSLGALLCASYAQGQILYQTDFSDPSLSANGLGSNSQEAGYRDAFITDVDSANYFGTANDNYLYINRQPGGSSDAVGFSVTGSGIVDESAATPLTRFAFDLNVRDNGAGAITFASYVGDSTSAVNRTLTMRFNWAVDEVRPNNTAAAAFAYDTAVSVELFTNNSSDTITYQSPTGTATLDSGRYSLFVDEVLKLGNTNAGTNDAAGNVGGIGSFTFSYFGNAADNKGTTLMDDFEITAIPEPRYAAALFGFGVILLTFLRRRIRR